MWKFTSIHTVIHVGSNGSLVNSNKDSLIDCYFYFFGKAILIDVFLPQVMCLCDQTVKGSYVCLSTPKQKGGLILIQRSVPPHVSSHHTRLRGDQRRARQMECGILVLAVAHHHVTLGTVGGLRGVWVGFQSNSMVMKSRKKASGHPEPVYCLCSVVERWNFIIFFSWNRTLRLCSAHVELRS